MSGAQALPPMPEAPPIPMPPPPDEASPPQPPTAVTRTHADRVRRDTLPITSTVDGINNLSSKCTCPKLLADLQPTIRAVKEEAERAAADDQSHEDRGPV